MPLTINETSMIKELNSILIEDDKYISISWATLARTTPKLSQYFKEGNLSKIGNLNIYCYVGITKSHLNIVTLNALDVTRPTGKLSIPLYDIKNISIKNSFLKCSISFLFNNESFIIHWIKYSGGTGIKKQKYYVQQFINFLTKRYSV